MKPTTARHRTWLSKRTSIRNKAWLVHIAGDTFVWNGESELAEFDMEQFNNLKHHMIGKFASVDEFVAHIKDADALGQVLYGNADMMRSFCYSERLYVEEHLIALEERFFQFSENTDVSYDEMRLLESATHHGLMYHNAQVQDLDGFVTYDLNSAYPFCLLQSDLRIPKHAPVKRTRKTFDVSALDDPEWSTALIEELLASGKILIAHVRTSDDGTWGFKNGFYTSYHLLAFRLLGITFSLVPDEPVWVYEKTKKAGDVYRMLIERFASAKQTHNNKTAKHILNLVWGASCESRRHVVKHRDVSAELLADPDVMIVEATPKTIAYVRQSEGFYKFRMARMKPFVLGYCTWMLSKQIARVRSISGGTVARVHTDSICCNIPIDSGVFPLSDNFGDYKVEKVHAKGTRYEHVNKLTTSSSVVSDGFIIGNDD